jgi:hypothetical protein
MNVSCHKRHGSLDRVVFAALFSLPKPTSKAEVELEYLRAYATTLGCWVAGSGEEDTFSVQEEEGWKDPARRPSCSSGSLRTKDNGDTGTLQTEA